MKKTILVLFLIGGIISLTGCSLTEQKQIDNPEMITQISVLQKQMSDVSSQVEDLKNENKKLKVENENLKDKTILLSGNIISDEKNENIDIYDVQTQLTKINRFFQKDGKRFGEFDYLQSGGDSCGYVPCYKNENKKIRIIEIDKKGEFYYFDSPVYDENNNFREKEVSFEYWYKDEHPYTSVRPQESNLDSVFIITVADGKVISIREDYSS